MHPDVIALFVGFLLFGLIGGIVYMAVRDGPGSKEWELEYDKRWFADNKYCMVCGKLNDWQPEGGVQYDSRDGRPYMQEVWGCSTAGHTFNRLIERAQRRDYGDAPAPEA